MTQRDARARPRPDERGRRALPSARGRPSHRDERVRFFLSGTRTLILLPLLAAFLLALPAAQAAARGPARPLELVVTALVVPAPPDGLTAPAAVAVDHRGRFLIADAADHRVVKIDRDGRFLDEFGSFGWTEDGLDGPSDLAVIEGFRVYVLDEGNRRVVRFDERGRFVDVIVEEGEAGTPVGVALGPASELYLVDSETQTVLVRSQFDEALEPFGRFGAGEGGLVDPVDVSVGPDLRVAVADPGGRAVHVFDQFGAELGSATASDTLEAVAVQYDVAGRLFVCDRRHRRVVVFDGSGRWVTASLDLEGVSPGYDPVSMALGPDNAIAVLDGRTGLVAVIEPSSREEARQR